MRSLGIHSRYLLATSVPERVGAARHTYRDPYYDGLQREFRGFASAVTTTVGDVNSPTSASRTELLLGKSPFTAKSDRWKDNPNEALKGLPTIAETYDPATGVYLSTTATTYALRKLYSGADGRGVYTSFPKQSDAWIYDTSQFVAAPATAPAVSVEQLSPAQLGDELTIPQVKARATAVRIASDVEVDNFGQTLRKTAYGQVGVDETITSYAESALIPAPEHILGEGNWAFRGIEGWVEGSIHTSRRNWSRMTYDGHAYPIRNEVHLAGSVPLIWTDPAAPADSPLPDGWYVTGETVYDSVGNAVFTWAAGNRCSSLDFDPDFQQFPIVERVHTGATTTLTVEGETYTCGDHALEAIATYDRGLQVLETATDINGGAAKVVYDALGRMKELYSPNPHTAGLSTLPS
ncbi:MAG: hypothetical protein FWD57_09875, partial [Polyangiaceae bacterium]|nr:hypothetical protein [Polyangiaceae bacterium]